MSPKTILLAIDGMRSIALAEANCSHIKELKQRGSFTMQAQSVMPSITLPCFVSIFHSIPPSRHGTPHNTFIPMARPVPGLVDVARAQGKKSAFFYNWEPLRDLNSPLSLSFACFKDNLYEGCDCDHYIAEQALYYMQRENWDFVFIYLGSLDLTGHTYGFFSPEYAQQLEHLDSAVEMILNWLPVETTLMLTSDHGGHARTHGTDSPDDMVIPWFMVGPNIRVGHEVASPISLLDIAPTFARLLEITPHPEWEGHCIDEAFKTEVERTQA
jgi:predicted AlkP superfamily pyrophosphatase or phosphodiesterase